MVKVPRCYVAAQMAEAVGELDGTGAVVRPMSRRNSISEAPVASAAPGLPEVLSVRLWTAAHLVTTASAYGGAGV